MEKFDFEHKNFKKHHPLVQSFLRRAKGSGMSQSAFVAAYKVLPRPMGKAGRAKSKRGQRSPSHLRQMYQRLESRFGFF